MIRVTHPNILLANCEFLKNVDNIHTCVFPSNLEDI